MSQVGIIFYQIGVLATLTAIGFIAFKLKIIDESIRNGIAKIIVNITMPILIVSSLTNLNLTGDMVKNSVTVIIFALIALILLYIGGASSAKLLNMEQRTKSVYVAHSIFGNVAFLGYPLLNALFPGGEGLLYAILFHLINDFILWTFGVYLLGKHRDDHKDRGVSHLVNPNTISFVVGILMLTFKWQLPGVINQAFSGLGGTTIYFSMVFVGASLAGISFSGVYKNYRLLVLNLSKMIIIPIIMIWVLKLANEIFAINMSDAAKFAVIIETAMPANIVVSVLAREFGADDTFAAENVFVSTVLGIITLPFIYYLASMIL